MTAPEPVSATPIYAEVVAALDVDPPPCRPLPWTPGLVPVLLPTAPKGGAE